MPIPTTIDDLSATIASNSPSGADSATEGDNYLRAHAAFIAQLRDLFDDLADPDDVANGDAMVAVKRTFTDAVATTVHDLIEHAEVDVFDVLSVAERTAVTSGSPPSNLSAKIASALTALNLFPETRLDTIGGSNITMYRSGVLKFGPGVFKIPANTLQITDKMGLTFKGAGSRRFTNAIQGRTTLLVTGAATSTGYGISLYRNGARSVHFEDLDICYESASFTGHLIDMIDAPGLHFYRCYLGTFGITGGTRNQTSASLLRLTYQEDVLLEDCVLDGSVDGVLFDNARTELGNTFGGWGVVLNRCAFYDFTGTMVISDGARTMTTLSIIDTRFNPINVDPIRVLDVNNVDGLEVRGAMCSASVGAVPSIEWMRLVNCTGCLNGSSFGSLAKAGTLNGNLSVEGNVLAGTDGFTLTGGVISTQSNEVSTGTTGFDIAPTEDLCVVLGPDRFKADVTNSYRVAADSASLSGRINYNSSTDASTAGFTNASGRITVRNTDERQYSITATTYTLLTKDTGRTARATGSAGQVFTLPNPSVPGTKHRVFKASTQTLQIDAASGALYAGTGATKTSIAASASSDVGGWVEFEAYDAGGWAITTKHGNWTIT